ncbi:MAG: alpha/beta hydrolase [Mycobacterium sp.]|jgi:pimeloyl-ACP methyl ester carboxylesterase
MSTDGIVLVHGGFHCAECWDLVLPHLNRPTVAVDLPGRRACPADLATVTLQDCVAAVLDAADHAGFDRFMLAGHSIGGVTITETAWQHPERTSHLVYIAGLVPPPGGSVSMVMSGSDFPGGAMPMIDEPIAKELFGNDLDDQQWAQFWAACVPETANVLNARLGGYPFNVPATYVSMTDDVAVPPELAETMMAIIGDHVSSRVICAGHSVMFSKPVELARVINSIADQAN